MHFLATLNGICCMFNNCFIKNINLKKCSLFGFFILHKTVLNLSFYKDKANCLRKIEIKNLEKIYK